MEKETFTSERIQVITKMIHSLVGGFKSQAKENFKKNEIKLLVELNFNPDLPQKHYVDSLGMEFGSFTYLSDKLIEKGYVIKVPSTTDRRITILSLTDKGREASRVICEEFEDHVFAKIELLNSKDQKKLDKAFKLIEEIYNQNEVTDE